MVTKTTSVYHDDRVVDLYRGDDPPRCLVVHFHGGGFRQGVHDHPSEVACFEYLVGAGYAVASGQYRLLMAGLDPDTDDPAVIADELAELGVPVETYTALGAGHEWAWTPYTTHRDAFVDFIDEVVLGGEARGAHHRFVYEGDPVDP